VSAAQRFAALAVAFALGIGCVFAQVRIDGARAASPDQVLYLPNERLLHHFTGGMSGVIANLLWIECIQYIAREFHGEQSYKWLLAMIDTITRLDPHFADVYRYGGMFLAALRADSDGALDVLNRGAVLNPYNWEIPYEAAMVYLLNRRNEPGSKKLAARYMTIAAQRPNAPQDVIDSAAYLQREFDMVDLERQLWTAQRESGDTLLRELAERKLIELELREVAKQLTAIAERYRRERGEAPPSVDALYAFAGIQKRPVDPEGGSFFLHDGTVYSTTVLDGKLEDAKRNIREVLDQWKEAHGAWPAELRLLVVEGPFKSLPEHPYPERDWSYDPETGALE